MEVNTQTLISYIKLEYQDIGTLRFKSTVKLKENNPVSYNESRKISIQILSIFQENFFLNYAARNFWKRHLER